MIENIKLENEITAILNQSVEEEFPQISMVLHTPNEDITIDYLTSLDVERDFEKSLADIIYSSFIMQLGDYANRLYKNRSRLEATLCIKRKNKQNCVRYKALILNVDKNITSSKLQSLGADKLNNINVVEVKLQLIPIELILLKKVEHEGIYSNVTRDEVIKKSMLYELSKVKLYNEYFKLNYYIYESDFKDKLETVLIPTGTKIGKIPLYVQEHYGLYNFSANAYFKLDNDINKNLYIWVYPTVDFKRVEKERNICMVYNTIRTGLSMTEKSYYKNNGQLKLVTDTSEISGDNYNNLFNIGKGIEYQKVSDNLQGFKYDIDNNKDISLPNKRVMINNVNDGMDFTRNIGLTDNVGNVNSLLTYNKIAYIQTVIYNFSGLWGEDPANELIYPGMPIYYIYNTKNNGINKIMRLPGTIMKQYISFQILKKTMSTVLLLGVKKPILALEEENG